MSGTSIVPSSSDSPKKANRVIAYITGLLTLLLALFSFILSFNALADLASANGVSLPLLFPLIVEAGVVIFSLNALYRSLHGESARWQWALVIGSSLLAGSFNVIHAKPNPVARIMAAMPSLFLLLSFETFLSQVKYAVRQAEIIQSLSELEAEWNARRSQQEQELENHRSELNTLTQEKQTEIERLQTTADQLTASVQKLEHQQTGLRSEIAELHKQKRTLTPFNLGNLNDANQVRVSNKQQAQQALLQFFANHPDASLKEAGEAIGRSKSTVANYLDELAAAGRIAKNGNGWEVIDDD